jgi:hypothetical protein
MVNTSVAVVVKELMAAVGYDNLTSIVILQG